jgi:hypothetical protein
MTLTVEIGINQGHVAGIRVKSMDALELLRMAKAEPEKICVGASSYDR